MGHLSQQVKDLFCCQERDLKVAIGMPLVVQLHISIPGVVYRLLEWKDAAFHT